MKINDHRRIQLLWDEVNSQSQSKSQPPTTMQEGAKELLLEYAEELTLSIIESAGALAQSRGAKQIDDSDIALLLAKKLGVELPGYEVNQPLYHNNLKSSIYSTSSERNDLSEQRKGIKRKHGG
mmetsp:Transcript_14951/g.16182  ORF Transcript_14951/g.16182 Transcript_14951/m.16182 type:complete len:124 (-) Transcript_14951:61-432(-)|eukprot:gene817-870_t